MDNKSILWIEDDYYHVKGLIRPLVKDGFKIDIAHSCNEAIEKLSKNTNYAIIILDLIIPYAENELMNSNFKGPNDPAQNGIDLFNYIKTKLKLDIPIVILSIIKDMNIKKELLKNGATIWLDKDKSLPQDVKETVVSVLKMN